SDWWYLTCPVVTSRPRSRHVATARPSLGHYGHGYLSEPASGCSSRAAPDSVGARSKTDRCLEDSTLPQSVFATCDCPISGSYCGISRYCQCDGVKSRAQKVPQPVAPPTL